MPFDTVGIIPAADKSMPAGASAPSVDADTPFAPVPTATLLTLYFGLVKPAVSSTIPDPGAEIPAELSTPALAAAR